MEMVATELKPNSEPCEHVWVKKKETIAPVRTDRQVQQGHSFTHEEAYFITQVCAKCNKRRVMDMKVI